jgi:hypothetical protein
MTGKFSRRAVFTKQPCGRRLCNRVLVGAEFSYQYYDENNCQNDQRKYGKKSKSPYDIGSSSFVALSI